MRVDLMTRMTAADPALDRRLRDHRRAAILEAIKAAPAQRRRSPTSAARAAGSAPCATGWRTSPCRTRRTG